MACDSVVTIDNSTAHLAGALGQNVKVLLPFAHDWRWGFNDLSSYWYDNVELYRQNLSRKIGRLYLPNWLSLAIE